MPPPQALAQGWKHSSSVLPTPGCVSALSRGREEDRGQRELLSGAEPGESPTGWRRWEPLMHRPPSGIWIVADTAGYEAGKGPGHCSSCVGAKVGDRVIGRGPWGWALERGSCVGSRAGW